MIELRCGKLVKKGSEAKSDPQESAFTRPFDNFKLTLVCFTVFLFQVTTQ